MVKLNSLRVSVKGPGHEIDGLPNQDAALIKKVPTGWIAVVCDGMGSKPYADLGSQIATKAVYQVLHKSKFDIESRILIKSVYQCWLDSLGEVQPNQAVTTCLFAWLSHDGKLRTFQLGDGAIYVPNQANHDAKEHGFGNETTGLGISTKLSDWKINEHSAHASEYVALMTDGISEDIVSGMESDFVESIIENTLGKSARRAKDWMKNELRNWGTPNHLDDKTLALLVIKNER